MMMKLLVTTLLANGFMTKWDLCTMGLPAVQSRKVKTASLMEDLTWVTSSGDGSQIDASFRGLNRMHFFNFLLTNI